MTAVPVSLLVSSKNPSRTCPRAASARLLLYAGVLSMLQGFVVSPAFSQTPAGWKTTQDMSKTCQIAFPASWTVTPDGQATTPDGGQAVLVFGSDRPLTPLEPGMQKLLQVDRLIENSPKRVFYLMKPQGDKLEYIVDQQFRSIRCKFQLFVPKGYSETDVMKIVATLGSTR